MALNPKTCTESRNLALDAAMNVLNSGGTIRIYDGLQPTDANTALGAQNMLAELSMSATAFGAAAAGSKAAAAITSATVGVTGTAAWGCFFKTGASSTNRVQDFSVGTGTANLVVNSVAFQSGANISISSFNVTMGA
jgi:hypothetical protein